MLSTYLETFGILSALAPSDSSSLLFRFELFLDLKESKCCTLELASENEGQLTSRLGLSLPFYANETS